jgi:hypothetical protein
LKDSEQCILGLPARAWIAARGIGKAHFPERRARRCDEVLYSDISRPALLDVAESPVSLAEA